MAHLSEDFKHAGIGVREAGNTAGNNIRLGYNNAVSVHPQTLAGQIDLHIVAAKGQGISFFVINGGVCSGTHIGNVVNQFCFQGSGIQICTVIIYFVARAGKGCAVGGDELPFHSLAGIFGCGIAHVFGDGLLVYADGIILTDFHKFGKICGGEGHCGTHKLEGDLGS